MWTLKTAAENSALPSQEQTTFENVLTRNSIYFIKNHLFGIFYNITVHCISDQIKQQAWVSIRTFFQKCLVWRSESHSHAPACRPPCTCADGTAEHLRRMYMSISQRPAFLQVYCAPLMTLRLKKPLQALTAQQHYNESQMLCLHIRLHTSIPQHLGAGPFFLLTGWPSAQTHRK